MSQTASPSAGKTYGLACVCQVWGLPRWRQQSKRPGGRRRPQGFHSNAALAGQIKAEIASRPFPGEGYRKIWAGLRAKGIRTSPTRTLRLMRENNWLAPTRIGSPHGPKGHDGTIETSRVDEMWFFDAQRGIDRGLCEAVAVPRGGRHAHRGHLRPWLGTDTALAHRESAAWTPRRFRTNSV